MRINGNIRFLVLTATLCLVFASTALPARAGTEAVKTVTQDGWTLEGDLHTPGGVENPPLVILVHMWGKDRKDFQQLVPYFLKEGFALLAYDIRGHGRSVRREKEIARYSDFKTADDQERMVLDVKAWLDFLSERPELKQSRFGILGGSIGGNIAFVSSGAFPKLTAAVALSASYNDKGVLVGNSVEEGFKPKNILFIAGENDPGAVSSARKFDTMSSGDHEVKVIEGSDKHGVNLILAHEEAFRMCVDWLKKHLK